MTTPVIIEEGKRVQISAAKVAEYITAGLLADGISAPIPTGGEEGDAAGLTFHGKTLAYNDDVEVAVWKSNDVKTV